MDLVYIRHIIFRLSIISVDKILMNHLQKKRLYYFLTMLAGIGIGVGLILYSLKQNINLFLTPTELVTLTIAPEQTIRLGGLVKMHSIQRDPQNLNVTFIVTDHHHDITVSYQGIPPDLFREGSGVIAEGKLNKLNQLQASLLLAKHDENYLPKNVYQAIRAKTS